MHVLTTAWVLCVGSACTSVAVLFSGHARSFAHARVRAALRLNVLERLECERVDTFFYLAADDAVPSERREWDVFSAAPALLEAEVRTLCDEFAPLAVEFHREGAGLIKHACGARGAPLAAFSQLQKLAACYRLVEAEELRRGVRYEWLVRARPDLAWIAPLAPLRLFPNDRVYLGAQYWPVGDQFALVPREFGDDYFLALESFYECESVCDEFDAQVQWFAPGVGAPESLLFRRLARRRTPVQLYDGFAYAIARFTEGANCATLHLLHFYACSLLNAQVQKAFPAVECQRAVHAVYAARCASQFPGASSNASSSPVPSSSAALEAIASALADADADTCTGTQIVTTSGMDGPRVAGQLALRFELARAPGALAELRESFARLAKVFARGALAAEEESAREAAHNASIGLWAAHAGTLRCSERCSETDARDHLLSRDAPSILLCMRPAPSS